MLHEKTIKTPTLVKDLGAKAKQHAEFSLNLKGALNQPSISTDERCIVKIQCNCFKSAQVSARSRNNDHENLIHRVFNSQ